MSDRHIIDVERLVDELKERVVREREAGAYADDFSGVELEVIPLRGDGLVQGFDLLPGEPRVRFRPELGFSSKPVIGIPITLVKRLILRLISFVMDDLARQTDAAVTRLEAGLAAEAAARESSASTHEAAVKAETAAREAVAVDVRGLSERLDQLSQSIDRLPSSCLRLDRRLVRASG